MALLKKILKNDPREVIVKWTGDGSDTLTLASLIATDQTVSGGVAPAVNILSAATSLGSAGVGTITRNSQVALNMYENFEFQTDGLIQAVLNENSTHDIVVNLSATGTLIMRVKKMQGYTGI